MVRVTPDMSDEEIISLINAEVRNRTSYGRRTESAGGKKPWRKVEYSCAHGDWWQYWEPERGSYSLDASQIGIVGISRRKLEPLLEKIDTLPLASGSYESRSRGTFSLSGISVPPALKEILFESGKDSLDIQSQIALENKFEES